MVPRIMMVWNSIPSQLAKENLRARSLKDFCEKYKPEIAIRSSMSDYREQDWMVKVPLYALDKYIDNIQ